MLFLHAMVTLVTLWIFVSTLKLDPSKPDLMTQALRRRALAKLKLEMKLRRSFEKMGAIVEVVDIPQPVPSSPGF